MTLQDRGSILSLAQSQIDLLLRRIVEWPYDFCLDKSLNSLVQYRRDCLIGISVAFRVLQMKLEKLILFESVNEEVMQFDGSVGEMGSSVSSSGSVQQSWSAFYSVPFPTLQVICSAWLRTRKMNDRESSC